MHTEIERILNIFETNYTANVKALDPRNQELEIFDEIREEGRRDAKKPKERDSDRQSKK